ncbi:MAG: phage virion morphogenesis protein [bacterium]
MDEAIEIKIDNKELNQVLDKLFEKTTDLKPLMKNIAGSMADAVEENFKQEGRPEWAKLKDSTIKVRTQKGYWPGKILQMRGELAASITTAYDESSAIVGSNKEYARIHQLGGDAGRNKKTKILARPYLKLDEKDIDNILQLSLKHLEH